MKTSIQKKEQNATLNASKKQTRPPMNTVGLDSDDHASIREILSKQALQPKLKISQPNDKYEQEADRIVKTQEAIVDNPETRFQRKSEKQKAEHIQEKVKPDYLFGSTLSIPLAVTQDGRTIFSPHVGTHPSKEEIEAHEAIHRAQFAAIGERPTGTRKQLEAEAQIGARKITTKRPFACQHAAEPGISLYFGEWGPLRPAKIPISPILRPGDLTLAPGESLEIEWHTFEELGMLPPVNLVGFKRYKIFDSKGRLVRHYITFSRVVPPELPPIPDPDAPEPEGLPMLPFTPKKRTVKRRKRRDKKKTSHRKVNAGPDALPPQKREWNDPEQLKKYEQQVLWEYKEEIEKWKSQQRGPSKEVATQHAEELEKRVWRRVEDGRRLARILAPGTDTRRKYVAAVEESIERKKGGPFGGHEKRLLQALEDNNIPTVINIIQVNMLDAMIERFEFATPKTFIELVRETGSFPHLTILYSEGDLVHYAAEKYHWGFDSTRQ